MEHDLKDDKVNQEDLEAFILDSNLEKLEKELGKFNLFDVFNSTHNEYLHSQVIRWLLDPTESHGLMDYFIKTFLKKVLTKNRNHKHAILSPIDIDVFDFEDSLVQSEEVFSNKRRGDISITNSENKLYILIENKILSSEGNEQTKTYVEETKKRYPEYDRIYIYLTAKEESAEAEEFLTFSYSDLIEVINNVLLAKGDEMNDNSRFVVSQLKRNLEVNVMEDSNIEDLCLKIYKKHKKAIDKISEIKPSNKQIYDSFGQSVVSALSKDWLYNATNSCCTVFRKEWRDKFNPKSHQSFFHYEFDGVNTGRIRTAIHIEGWGDKDLRKPLKDKLRKTDFIKIKEVDLGRGQVILVKKVVNNIDDIDKAVKDGGNAMVKLINETWKYLDDASKSI